MSFVKLVTIAGMFWCTLGVALSAEEAEGPSLLSLELNTAETVDSACRLTFVVQNRLSDAVNKLVLETVLFTTDGQVALMTLFDFGDVPKDRRRVRQFQVPQTGCETLQQVLINGVQACEITDTASPDCQTGLALSSRTKIEMAG